MQRRRFHDRPAPSARGALPLAFALLAGACGGGGGIVPPALTERVAGARTSLEDNWEQGLITPAFDFVEARCRADKGLLLTFAVRGVGASGFAYTMQGSGAPPDGWSGGFTQDLATDPEIQVFFTESPEASCRF